MDRLEAGVGSLTDTVGDVRLRSFQRNTAFTAFIFIVCFAALLYVTESLRGLFVPLVWSGFFAVPLTALISDIDKVVIALITLCLRPLRGRQRHPESVVQFDAYMGQNKLWMDQSQAVVSLLSRVNHPCRAYCGKWSTSGFSCCRRRVRISQLDGGASDGSPEVNRLVQGWCYYARDPLQDGALDPLEDASSWHARSRQLHSPLATDGDVATPLGAAMFCVELFVDPAHHYPAIYEARDASRSPEMPRRLMSGTLEIEGSSGLSWFISVVLAMALVVGGVVVFISCLSLGAAALQDAAPMYQKGATEALAWIGHYVNETMPAEVWEGMDTKARSFVVEAIPDFATGLFTLAQGIGFQLLLFLLYLSFWIFEPLPINSSVAQVFKAYFLLKTLVCLLYAGLMSLLLLILGCKFWHLFFLITFVLNYIPEIGSLLAAVLMLPAVLLDGSFPIERRYSNTFWLCVFGMIFKIVTANIIEVQCYTTRGGEFMRMHPVILMALMMFCEQLMGITGMFLAVPIMAAVKYYLVSVDMPGVYLDPLLTMLEGDAHGPHKNFVDRHRVEMEAREDLTAKDISTDVSGTGGDTDLDF